MTERSSPESQPGSATKANVDWQAALAEHDRWLRTVVYTRLGEADAVDEVMQEVALAAVKQAAPLNDASKAAPWLYRLAVRQSLLYRRRCGRQRKLVHRFVDRGGAGEASPESQDPLQWLLASEQRQMVRTALERLAERDAEILLLKYSERWCYHQIAAHLGIGHSAVEARLHRARQRLRKTLTAMKLVEVPQ